MAIIKAGTYRFNDVLTQLTTIHPETGYNEVSLPFTFTSNLGVEGYKNTLFRCSKIYQEPRTEEEIDISGVGSLAFTAVASTPDLTPLGYTYPMESYVWEPEGWRMDGAQTITVTADTEATEEFATWFNANTVEVKPIIKAGTYRFNDVIVGSPNNNGDDVFLYNNLPFTCTLINPYGTFTGYCTGIKAQNHYIDGVEIYYSVETIEPPTPLIDVPNSDFNVYRDSWSIDYGETFQVITVTADTEATDKFATWFSANTVEVAKPVIKAGTYKFNDVLTVIPYETFSLESITDKRYWIVENHGLDIKPVVVGQDGMVATLTRFSLANTFGDVYIDGEPKEFFDRITCSAILDGQELAMSVEVELFYGTTFTVLTEQEVSPEFYDWFIANAVEVVEGKQISGKWKFSDVLTRPSANLNENVNFEFPFIDLLSHQDVIAKGYNIHTGRGIDESEDYYWGSLFYKCILTFSGGDSFDQNRVVYYEDDEQMVWSKGDATEEVNYQIIDFGSEPQTVSAEFYEWFTSNASQPTAIISYNGSSVVDVFAGQTATLKCAGMKMATDVVIEIAENIGGGECDKPHVIEVDTLPTSNIDDNALYKVGDTYYQHKGEFLDIWILDDYTDDLESLVKEYTEQGANVQLYYARTKPTDNIQITDARANFHVYFIEDEDNAFVYMQGMWIDIGTALELPYIGAVENTENIIVRSAEDVWGLYAVVHKGWKNYPWVHQEVTSDTGALLIEGNGTYDVSTQERVTVDVDSVVGVWEFNKSIVTSHTYKFNTVKDCSVRFTTRLNGETIEGIGMGLGEDHGAGTLQYYFADGSYVFAFGPSMWYRDELRTVDFGTEPQIVSAEFKAWLTANATKQESGGAGGDEVSPMDKLIERTIEEVTTNATKIGAQAFYYNSTLKKINCPNAEVVGQQAFYYCSNLTDIYMPSVTYVNDYAFNVCAALKRVVFPNVGTISNYAFQSCEGLILAEFDKLATLNNSFSSCKGLQSFVIRNETSCNLRSSSCFNSTPISSGTGYIYVPYSLVDSYKSATNWSRYASQIRAIEEYTVDGTITGELDLEKMGVTL